MTIYYKGPTHCEDSASEVHSVTFTTHFVAVSLVIGLLY